MRINLKRLTDAVPELMELEFIAEDTAILISTTISIQQAEDLYSCLRSALTAHFNDNKASGATCALPPSLANNAYGLPDICYNGVVAYLKGSQKINAIKLIREVTNLGLKESKDIADAINEKILKGEL